MYAYYIYSIACIVKWKRDQKPDKIKNPRKALGSKLTPKMVLF